MPSLVPGLGSSCHTLNERAHNTQTATHHTQPRSTHPHVPAVQLAAGYAVHVPAATLGEMVYASNVVIDSWRTAAAEAAAANTTVPANVTLVLWVNAWGDMALALKERAEESNDVLSKRALLFRRCVLVRACVRARVGCEGVELAGGGKGGRCVASLIV